MKRQWMLSQNMFNLSVVALLTSLLFIKTAHAASLQATLEQVWAKNPQAQTLEAKRAESEAQSIAANSLLPAAPAIMVGQRSDQWNNNNGRREWEAGIALPVWIPGQRDARQNQAQIGKDSLNANILAMRLRLAGELRENIWQVRQAQAQIQLDEARMQSAKKLADDVARRTQAGELAKTDLNLAQNEWRTTQAAVLQSRIRLLQLQQAYAAMTGMTALPDDAVESVSIQQALPEQHPILEEARLAIELAQAQIRVVSNSRRDNPEVEISTRSERNSFNDPYGSTIAVSLRVPLSTNARNLPLESAAQTVLTGAQSEYTRTRLTLEFQLQQAQQAVQVADQMLELAQQQRTAARENLALIQKSFSLGESDLFTLLRARAAAFEAEQSNNQQTIAQALARARLNQAQGVLP